MTKSTARTITDTDIDVLIERFSLVFPKKEEIEEIVDKSVRKQVGLLPTRDEFYAKMDSTVGELLTTRVEQVAIADVQVSHTTQLADHNKRIKKLEKVTFSAS